jgi:hypothetical protein
MLTSARLLSVPLRRADSTGATQSSVGLGKNGCRDRQHTIERGVKKEDRFHKNEDGFHK